MHLVQVVPVLLIICDKTWQQKNFICKGGNEIDFNLLCNGNKDCADGSDETADLCFQILCPKEKFKCSYGACIEKSKRCDGYADCADTSDELRCDGNKAMCSKIDYPCTSGECVPNIKICDGEADCSDSSDETDALCQDIACPEYAFHCQIGGCIRKENLCDGFRDCLDGSDETEAVCAQIECRDRSSDICEEIHCPAITSPRLTVTCNELDESGGTVKGLITCDKPVPVGTRATYACKDHYKPVAQKHFDNNTKAVCQVDGTWSRSILKCEPECGKADDASVALVVHGWSATPGQWPWHAALYCREDGNWTYWCGGSLISETIVLTAAHCVWDMNINEFVVAVGKYRSNFEETEDYTQIKKLNKIFLQPLYQDILGNYGSDIAVLVLSEPVKFSKFVNPICVDWKSEYAAKHLKENSLGTVVGMGVMENDIFADHLKVTTLPVVAEEDCIKNQKKDFKKYVTYTTFCAGYSNGTSVCNGDSGGGLTFREQQTGLWYLQGIVSVSPRRQGTTFCDPRYYTIFTKLSKYIDWLQNILIAHDIYLTDEVAVEENVVT